MNPAVLFFRLVALGSLFGLAIPGMAQNAPAAGTPKPPPPLKDADGRTLRRAPTGHVTNYYEEKVPAYTLPDPLVLADGRPVRDADSWCKERRPELLKAYETEIYGRVPASAPKVRFEVIAEKSAALGGNAVRQHLVGHFGDQPGGPAVNVMIYRNSEISGPLPLVLHITFGGDPDLPPLPPPPGTSAPSRRFNDMGPVETILARGYAYAIVRYAEIQPDRANSQHEGVIGLALPPGQEKPAPDEWGAISAWAWGLSRIMDQLQTLPGIDAKRV
ncbi:MAG TPA: hypothetical protein VHN79_12375, partial [Lacunisphaera sp.]|nr:hypothetical protein [Lacunisphaera sp.]